MVAEVRAGIAQHTARRQARRHDGRRRDIDVHAADSANRVVTRVTDDRNEARSLASRFFLFAETFRVG